MPSVVKKAASAHKRGKISNRVQARENMRPIPSTTGIKRGKMRVRLIEIGFNFALNVFHFDLIEHITLFIFPLQVTTVAEFAPKWPELFLPLTFLLTTKVTPRVSGRFL